MRSTSASGSVLRSTEAPTPEGGGFIDPTHAIDQHQRALGTEVAQINLRRASADAAAIGGESEIAGGG